MIETWVLISSMSLMAVSQPMPSQWACEDHVKNMTYKFVNNYCIKVDKVSSVTELRIIK